MLKHAILFAIGIASLVLHPFFGCGAKEDFRYGAADMRAAIEGTWKLTLPATEKNPVTELVMTISQGAEPTQDKHSRRRGLVADAAACAERSLVRSAGACVDMSVMPLDVKLLASTSIVRAGVFRVTGLRFIAGHLTFELGNWYLSARVTPDGSITKVTTNGSMATGATMVRMTMAQR